MDRETLQLQLLEQQIRKEGALADQAEAATAKTRNEIDDWMRSRENDDASAERALVYTFSAEVNKGSVDEAIGELSHWSRREPGSPITIFFNTPGGSTTYGFALYDFILELRRRGHFVKTVGLGWVCSMGTVLLQAGDDRSLGRNAWFMIHEPSRTSFMEHLKASDIDDASELFKRLWRQLAEVLAERAKIDVEEIMRRADRKDWWLTAEEALELGFIDAIEVAPAVKSADL